jgi:RNA polymerase sigma-70 factor (ECF subfamily)
LNSIVRTVPTWKSPVGLGGMRTQTGRDTAGQSRWTRPRHCAPVWEGWNFECQCGHYLYVLDVRTGFNLSDEEVVLRSLDEPERFGLLFDRYGDDVFRFLAAQMSIEAAEDATSEVFVAAFRSRRAYRGQAPPRAWLLGIAANIARRQWRSRSRFESALARLQVLTPSDRQVGSDPDRGLSGLSHVVRHALEALPHDQREALILRAWGGLTYGEIAAVVGIRVGTVRSRISRARASFAAALATQGGAG